MRNFCLFRYKAASDIDLNNADGEVVSEFMAYRRQLRNMLSAVGNFVCCFLLTLNLGEKFERGRERGNRAEEC